MSTPPRRTSVADSFLIKDEVQFGGLTMKCGRLSATRKTVYVVYGGLSVACGVDSVECGDDSAECGDVSVECGGVTAECGDDSVECGANSM